MIWSFDLNLYALILFWKILFEEYGQDCNKPKPTKMTKGFAGIVFRMWCQGQTWVPVSLMDGIPNIQKLLQRST